MAYGELDDISDEPEDAPNKLEALLALPGPPMDDGTDTDDDDDDDEPEDDAEPDEGEELVEEDPFPAADPIVELSCAALPAEVADGGLPAELTSAPPPPLKLAQSMLCELLLIRRAATAAATLPVDEAHEPVLAADEQELEAIPGAEPGAPDIIPIELYDIRALLGHGRSDRPGSADKDKGEREREREDRRRKRNRLIIL